MSKNNHDDHYKNFEKVLGHQPITVMEAVACNGLPQEFHAQAKRNLHVAMAIKYLLRLGSKDEANKEINKAENFLYRARTGSWRPVAEDLPLFAPPSFVPEPLVGGDRGPTVTVTTHGRQAEATEAEVGKAVANLRGVPTPNAPVQPRRKYPVVRECATCKHLGERLRCTLQVAAMEHDLYCDKWEPKPEEARVVPRGCASCVDGPGHNCAERRNGQCNSPEFPLWVAK